MLILWGVIAAAAALGVVGHRRRTPDEAPEYQSSLTFVGAAYGLLLGLLVVFAVGHYTDVRHEAQGEASTLVALQDTVRVYPPETSDPVRHDVVCYMRSIVHDEWPSMERGKDTPAGRTLGFGDRVRADGDEAVDLDQRFLRSVLGCDQPGLDLHRDGVRYG